MSEVIDMQEFFSRDPLTYTNDDITVVISQFRQSRKNFQQGNIAAGSTKPKTEAQKQIADLGSVLKLNL